MTGGLFNYVVYPYLIASNAVVGYVVKTARESCYNSLADENASWLSSWWKNAEATAICERVGFEVQQYYEPFISTLFKVGYLGIGIGYTGNKIYNLVRELEYYRFKNITPEQILEMNPTQVQSFLLGTQARESTLSQLNALVSYSTYRAPRSYWAGFAAKNHKDDTLIEKVKNRL